MGELKKELNEILNFFLRTKAKLKPVGLVKSCIGEVGQELNRYSQSDGSELTHIDIPYPAKFLSLAICDILDDLEKDNSKLWRVKKTEGV